MKETFGTASIGFLLMEQINIKLPSNAPLKIEQTVFHHNLIPFPCPLSCPFVFRSRKRWRNGIIRVVIKKETQSWRHKGLTRWKQKGYIHVNGFLTQLQA